MVCERGKSVSTLMFLTNPVLFLFVSKYELKLILKYLNCKAPLLLNHFKFKLCNPLLSSTCREALHSWNLWHWLDWLVLAKGSYKKTMWNYSETFWHKFDYTWLQFMYERLHIKMLLYCIILLTFWLTRVNCKNIQELFEDLNFIIIR